MRLRAPPIGRLSLFEALESRTSLSATPSSATTLAVTQAVKSATLAVTATSATVDTLKFGDAASESAHALVGTSTQTITGGLGQKARQLLPLSTAGVNGGDLTFTVAVDPTQRNYFTVKLWGSDDTDQGKGRLYLYATLNGVNYQVGYRHEGDYTPLSVTAGKQPLPGRFFYSTTLLPLALTKGKTSITLRIQSTGELYGLGSGAESSGGNYQMNMDTPSRGVYAAYTHTQAMLDVGGEAQGIAPAVTTRPSVSASSILGATGTYTTGLKNWALGRTTADVASFRVSDVQMLANAYGVAAFAWTSAQKTAIVNKVVAALDGYASDYYANPATSVAGTSDYGAANGNAGWGGAHGLLGWAAHLLKDVPEFANQIGTTANYGTAGGDRTRRTAWGDMLVASRDYGRFNRRTLTNQAILADFNIYKANRALLDLGDSRAFTEVAGQRYLKEAAGILPWSGNDLASGGSEWIWGHDYYQVTPDGLTREWGYGGGYGEMAVHVAMMFKMTGEVAYRNQAVKMTKAIANLRRPAVEVSGASNYRSMERVGLLAWRGVREADGYYANEVAYGGQAPWSSGMIVAGATLDPTAVGYAKQMLTDNQYLNSLVADPRYYSSLSFDSLYAFEPLSDYFAVANAADSGARLPMTAGQPDYAWSDELGGVAVVKKGETRLWVEPYWQAKTGTGVNGVGRFYFSTPTYEQYGTLETTPFFDSDGSYFVRPDNVDMPEREAYVPPDAPTQAYAGELLPIAASPADAADDTPYRGKTNGYAFRFGNYLFGTNSTASSSYALGTPVGFTSATDLVTQATKTGTVTVAPNSTVVLYLPSGFDAALAPATPLLLQASGATAGVTLNWSAASGATSYTVKRAANEGGPYATIATNVIGTGYVDTATTARGIYHYVVAAVNANGASYDSVDAAASAGLPAGWTGADVGAVALAGTSTYESGAWTLTGSGSDVGGNADSFPFTSASLTGNGTLTARLASTTRTNDGLDKVGLMLRASTAAGSQQFSVLLDLQYAAVRTPYRSTTNGGTTWAAMSDYRSTPTWLRITRSSNTFTSYYSADGTTWTQGASATIAMGTTVRAGLVVNSRTAQQTNATTFDNLSLTGLDTTPPTLISAASRKTHGGAGTFDLPIAIANTTSPTVEPRLGGPDTIRLTFSETVVAADGALDAGEFALSGATFDSASVSGSVVTLRLKNVATRSRITMGVRGLADAAGYPLAGTPSFVVRALYGDITQSGAVNILDQQSVKNGLGKPVNAATFLLDLNLSGGSINILDQQAVKNELGALLS